MLPPRPCERRCPAEHGGCGYHKHFSRFRSKTGVKAKSSWFATLCKDCEQKQRNIEKNKDRPDWIIRQRARGYATKYGVSFDFMWTDMNWRALVPVFRAMTTPDGLCLSCGHGFDSEPDLQIDHIEPPRNEINIDTARLHARNLHLLCASCNKGKSDTPFAEWLDLMEERRKSNAREALPLLVHPIAEQLTMPMNLPKLKRPE